MPTAMRVTKLSSDSKVSQLPVREDDNGLKNRIQPGKNTVCGLTPSSEFTSTPDKLRCDIRDVRISRFRSTDTGSTYIYTYPSTYLHASLHISTRTLQISTRIPRYIYTYPSIYLHVSLYISTRSPPYIYTYPSTYLHASLHISTRTLQISTRIPRYIYTYPSIYLHVSLYISTRSPPYIYTYPSIYLHGALHISTRITLYICTFVLQSCQG